MEDTKYKYSNVISEELVGVLYILMGDHFLLEGLEIRLMCELDVKN